MDLAAKQAELDDIIWYHQFDFGNGLRTRTHCPHIEQHRRIGQFVESHLAAVDFRDKTVLDIGAWDGYWSFYAEKRGARSVLASDDLGQNWSAGRGIRLAKELLRSNVQIDQRQSAYDLAARGQKFDVILFLGVYYHLHDPFYALAQIRHCCHEQTLVVIDGPVAINLEPNEALYDFEHRNCEWLPALGTIQQLLAATYFTAGVLGTLQPPSPPPLPPAAPVPEPPPPGRLGWRWRLGMCRDALRGSRAAMSDRLAQVLPPVPPPPPPPPRPHTHNKRIMLGCKPFAGVAELHLYRPPFGLHVYDPRFRDADSTAATEAYFRNQAYFRGAA